jgi:UTP:GlnB (protein PII) uridylyltransferase
MPKHWQKMPLNKRHQSYTSTAPDKLSRLNQIAQHQSSTHWHQLDLVNHHTATVLAKLQPGTINAYTRAIVHNPSSGELFDLLCNYMRNETIVTRKKNKNETSQVN